MLPQPTKIKIRTIGAGQLGDLSVIESSRDLPFLIRRIYYLHGMHRQARRGFHAHKELHQCLLALSGTCRLELEGPAGRFTFQLSRPDEGVLVPPGYWREMHDMDSSTVIMVLASKNYDEADYLRDYGEFRQWLAERDQVREVPYLDLRRYDELLGKQLEEAAAEVMKGGRYIRGPRLAEFERQFAAFCQTRRAVGVGNGLDALVLILTALDIGPGDDVLVCASGFTATAQAVSRVGARPLFVDCLPDGGLDPALAEAALTPATRAVIPTHLYGLPVDWAPLAALAEAHGLFLVEDACQAHGAAWRGRPCGSLGEAAAFSFYPTKNLGGLGDGGAVTTNNQALADRVSLLANHGSAARGDHQAVGLNSRLDELQAAFLSVKLGRLEEWNENRRNLENIYRETLADLAPDRLIQPCCRPRDTPVWHVYPVRIQGGRRDELADFLAARGVGTNIHYPRAIHQQPCYAAAGLRFPEAEALAAETLSLPLDALHRPEELYQVSRVVHEFFQEP